MHLINSLDNILASKPKLEILRFLLKTNIEASGREIARNVGLSHPTCHTALQSLVKENVIYMRKSGRTILYRLNNSNIIITEFLKPLFKKEGDLLKELITKYVRKLNFRIISCVLYGSFAKGEAFSKSDIDLFLLVPNNVNTDIAMDTALSIEAEFSSLIGNRISVVIYTENQFRNHIKNKQKLSQNILEEGILIRGKPLLEVLRK